MCITDALLVFHRVRPPLPRTCKVCNM